MTDAGINRTPQPQRSIRRHNSVKSIRILMNIADMRSECKVFYSEVWADGRSQANFCKVQRLERALQYEVLGFLSHRVTTSTDTMWSPVKKGKIERPKLRRVLKERLEETDLVLKERLEVEMEAVLGYAISWLVILRHPDGICRDVSNGWNQVQREFCFGIVFQCFELTFGLETLNIFS